METLVTAMTTESNDAMSIFIACAFALIIVLTHGSQLHSPVQKVCSCTVSACLPDRLMSNVAWLLGKFVLQVLPLLVFHVRQPFPDEADLYSLYHVRHELELPVHKSAVFAYVPSPLSPYPTPHTPPAA